MNTSLRHSLHALADLAARAPRLDGLGITAAQRRRRRTKRAAREAGWLGAGLVVGAGLTSIFTPATGAEVRKRLSEQGARLREFISARTNGESTPGATAKKKNTRDDRSKASREEGGFDAHA